MKILPDKCLCCCPLNKGVLVFAIIIFILNISKVLAAIIKASVENDEDEEVVIVGITYVPEENLIYAQYVGTFIEITLLILFFYGYKNDKGFYVLPFIIWFAIGTSLTILAVFLTITADATVIVSFLLTACLNIYIILCLISYYINWFRRGDDERSRHSGIGIA